MHKKFEMLGKNFTNCENNENMQISVVKSMAKAKELELNVENVQLLEFALSTEHGRFLDLRYTKFGTIIWTHRYGKTQRN